MKSFSLGTDCTGIDAGYFALVQCLGYKDVILDYRFASEIDHNLRSYLKHTTPVGIVYEDICTRDNATTPYVDVYIAGFPCQTFSSLGKRQGTLDARGQIFEHILEYLILKQSAIIILENVSSIVTHGKGKLFLSMLHRLRHNLPNHVIDYQTVCPTDISFPQKRSRVFIQAVRADLICNMSTCSKMQTTSVTLDSILLDAHSASNIDSSVTMHLGINQQNQLSDATTFLKMHTTTNIVDLGKSARFSRAPYAGVSPCLTRNASMFYIPEQQRYITAVEALRLQGFADETVANWLHLFDANHRNKKRAFLWAGNTICIPLLVHVLSPLIEGLINQN